MSKKIKLIKVFPDSEGYNCIPCCIVTCLHYFQYVRYPQLDWNHSNTKDSEFWDELLKRIKEKYITTLGFPLKHINSIPKIMKSKLPMTMKLINFSERTLNYCDIHKLPAVLIYDWATLHPRETTMLGYHAVIYLGQEKNIYHVHDPIYNRTYYTYAINEFDRAWKKTNKKGIIFGEKMQYRRKITIRKRSSPKSLLEYVKEE